MWILLVVMATCCIFLILLYQTLGDILFFCMIGEVAEASSTVVLSMCAAEERRKHCFNVGLRVGLRESNMRVSK